MPPRDADKLVRLAIAEVEMDAILWQDILRQEGIESLIRRRDALAAYGATSGLPYSHDLLVLESDLARAREALGLPPEE